jgi:hypothetical protein
MMMIVGSLDALDMVVSWFRSLVERTKESIGGELKEDEFFLTALLGVIELFRSGARYIPVQSVNQLCASAGRAAITAIAVKERGRTAMT